ncbi:MAG: polymer-forming cytoskeletal protein [Chloroflexota bacterium]|nr:polymer-forming cytoskeletal protein [Chloroflexota bacterium]
MSMRTFDTSSYASQRDDYDAPSDDQNESMSVIDRFSSFDGTYQSTRDVRIEGKVKGTIECQGTVHIAQGANVNARIEADNISVAGDLDGDINCRGRLQILPSGKVRGKINTVTLVINEGAHYEGELEMAAQDSRLSAGRGGRARPSLSSSTSPVPIGGASETARSTEQPASGIAQPGGNTFIRRFGGQETTWEDETPTDEDTEESSS